MTPIQLGPEMILAVGGAFLSGIVWLVRLEGKVKGQDRLIEAQEKRADSQDRQIEALKEKHTEMDSRIVNELTRIREALARMEGRLGFGGGSHGPDS